MAAAAAEPAIAPADAQALAWLRNALADAALAPLCGATEVLAACGPGGAPLGAGGLERFGADGLLRSLVVAPAQRGHGLGTRLVAALEAKARAHGMATLYLLTETAAPFFVARGYAPVARDEVPAAVAASGQFRLHCPASAACLRKRLRAPAHSDSPTGNTA